MSEPAETHAFTFRRYRDGDHEPPPWQEQIFNAGASHKCPVYVHRTSPCQGACPSGEDIRGWLAAVRGLDKASDGMSWQELAFRRMTAANPFPAVMGRVCPAPCEDACNRNEVEDHVGINAVEHFVGDWALANNIAFPPPDSETGQRVAVVGGGPAGLSAAYHLRRRGHDVTIFDDHTALGGMMRYGIPGYRTPRDVLDGEIARILAMGMETRLSTRIGRDVSMEDLQRDFDAIFWALGTHSGRRLPVPGTDAPNCITGVEFLRAFNEGRLDAVARRVVVVGGGDTSIDVASVARRLGHITQTHAKDHPDNAVLGNTAHNVATAARREGATVVLTSLFPVDQMTAAAREIADAHSEGVEIRAGIMPLEVLKDADGRAHALRMCQCTMDGMRPIPIADTEFQIPCDLVVSAIGQSGDLDGLAGLDDGRGFIKADRNLAVPGRRGEFTGGDIVRPHLLTTAIGHGRIAAESIHRFLRGEESGRRPRVDVVHFDMIERLAAAGLAPAPVPGPTRGTAKSDFAVHNYEDRAAHEIIPHEPLFLGHFATVPRNERTHRSVGEAVLGDFGERLVPLAAEQAVAEAKRCMSCGLCMECDSCMIYCPQDAITRVPKAERASGRYVETDYAKCVGCHICRDVCPSGYIQMGLGE